MTADLRHTRTIQQTGKGPKLIQLAGRLAFVAGLVCLVAVLADEGRTADHLIAPAVITMFLALGALFVARVLVWWRHD